MITNQTHQITTNQIQMITNKIQQTTIKQTQQTKTITVLQTLPQVYQVQQTETQQI